jgi:hypothetical protein
MRKNGTALAESETAAGFPGGAPIKRAWRLAADAENERKLSSSEASNPVRTKQRGRFLSLIQAKEKVPSASRSTRAVIACSE